MFGISFITMQAQLRIDPMIFVINYETFLTDPELLALFEEMAVSISDGSLSGIEIQNAVHNAREQAEKLYGQSKNNSLMAIILSLYSLELFMR